MRPPLTRAFLLAPLGLVTAANATDFVVDDDAGPGVDFTTIQAAVDTAQSGDHVRVRSGTYAGFVVDGKWLVVAEEPGADALVTGRVLVRNAPITGGVQVIGLRIEPSTAPGGASLEIGPSIGHVTLSRCTMRGWNAASPLAAMRVTDAQRVLLHDCSANGGHAAAVNSSSVGAPGIEVSTSSVELHGCTTTGGRGGSNWDGSDNDTLFDGQLGGAGLRIASGGAHAERSTFVGGLGGDSSSHVFDIRCAGDGGSGVLVWGGTFAHYVSTFTPGAGGIDPSIWSCNGAPGAPISPVGVATEPGRTPICFGIFDVCPCGNEGHGAAGCENSFGGGGALLDLVGSASLANDTLTLDVERLGPTAPALFFQGTVIQNAGSGSPFGDGLRCAAGSVIRLGSRAASGGASQFGFATGDVPISIRGQIAAPGTTRIYQVWYRNSAPFCTASTSNLSNGFEVRWDA